MKCVFNSIEFKERIDKQSGEYVVLNPQGDSK